MQCRGPEHRPLPALLTQLPQLAASDEWLDASGQCFGPYLRPGLELTATQRLAREQFPKAAERILRDLQRAGGRRFSTPAIGTEEMPLVALRRQTLDVVPTAVVEEVVHRREKTWAGMRQVSETSEASSSRRWKQPDSPGLRKTWMVYSFFIDFQSSPFERVALIPF